MTRFLVPLQVVELAKLAAKDSGRYAGSGVALAPGKAQITNGHYAVTLNWTPSDPDNYPQLPKPGGSPAPASEGCDTRTSMPSECIISASKGVDKKSILPVLLNLLVEREDGSVRVAGTDTQTVSTSAWIEPEQFPDLGKVTPAENTAWAVEVGFSPKYLRDLATLAVKLGVETLRLQVKSPLDVAVLSGKNCETTLDCLLMPMKIVTP